MKFKFVGLILLFAILGYVIGITTFLLQLPFVLAIGFSILVAFILLVKKPILKN